MIGGESMAKVLTAEERSRIILSLGDFQTKRSEGEIAQSLRALRQACTELGLDGCTPDCANCGRLESNSSVGTLTVPTARAAGVL
jgi:hypothetical protein